MSGINGRHRKHFKAGAVYRPGEQIEMTLAADSWAIKVIEFFKKKAMGGKLPKLLGKVRLNG